LIINFDSKKKVHLHAFRLARFHAVTTEEIVMQLTQSFHATSAPVTALQLDAPCRLNFAWLLLDCLIIDLNHPNISVSGLD
jgi:hypothetical protein